MIATFVLAALAAPAAASLAPQTSPSLAAVRPASEPSATPGSKASLKGKTMRTVHDERKAAWLHGEPDRSKWQIQCQLVYQVRSRIPKRVCATVGEWEAIAATGQSDLRKVNPKANVGSE